MLALVAGLSASPALAMTDDQANAAVPAAALLAQAAPADPLSAGDPPPNDIVVIGTRRTDRTLTNSPSPVDVISSA